MVDIILSALALVLILEGILPFLSPQKMRSFMSLIATMDDRTVRIIGLLLMTTGLILLYSLSPSYG